MAKDTQIKFTYEGNKLTIKDGEQVKVFLINDSVGEIFKYVLKAIDQLDDVPPYTEIFKIGNFSQVAKEGIDNPYGEGYDEEQQIPYWSPNVWDNCDLHPTDEEYVSPITVGPTSLDYPVIWKLVDHIYWESDDSVIDLRGTDITTLKVKVNLNGTDVILPIIEDPETQNEYYAGQAMLYYLEIDSDKEILDLWTHPFRVEFNDSYETGKFRVRVSIRETEDVVLNDVALIKENS